MRDLEARFAGRLRRHEPMSRHTSWHVGGPADWFFEPRDREDLAAFLQGLPKGMPIHWVGLGSNLLVRDGGLRGAVISLHGALGLLERRGDTGVWCDRKKTAVRFFTCRPIDWKRCFVMQANYV